MIFINISVCQTVSQRAVIQYPPNPGPILSRNPCENLNPQPKLQRPLHTEVCMSSLTVGCGFSASFSFTPRTSLSPTTASPPPPFLAECIRVGGVQFDATRIEVRNTRIIRVRMHNAIGVGDTNLISVRTEKRENLQTEQPLTGLGQSDIYL